MKNRIESALAVFGVVAALVLGVNAVGYAATGRSFVLGALNAVTKVTTLKNTGSGAALRLQTKATTSAPLVTSGRGLVKNLNVETVGGVSASQLKAAGIDPLTFTFKRTNAATGVVQLRSTNLSDAVVSNTGAQDFTYQLRGTVEFACDPTAGTEASDVYVIALSSYDAALVPTYHEPQQVPVSACGSPVQLAPRTVAMSPGTHIAIQVVGNALGFQVYAAPTLTFNIVGTPVRADL